ncbi:MAG TPA: hypothetical protein VJK53_03455 [Candidatus Paceibacterota bacterium]
MDRRLEEPMLFRNTRDFAQALRPILKDKVVIRYGVRTYPQISFQAELVVLESVRDREYIGHARVLVGFHRGGVEIESTFNAVGAGHLDDLCDRWAARNFNDWLHDEPFMGAYDVYLDRMPHTSVKLEAPDGRWRLLTGAVLGALARFEVATAPEVETSILALMRKRFSAFAAQSEAMWARQHLNFG